jgi:hypothetical protein
MANTNENNVPKSNLLHDLTRLMQYYEVMPNVELIRLLLQNFQNAVAPFIDKLNELHIATAELELRNVLSDMKAILERLNSPDLITELDQVLETFEETLQTTLKWAIDS